MASRKSTGVVDKAINWIRGFFSQGAGQLDRTSTGKPGDSGRELPDLDASESDYRYTGSSGDSGTMPEEAGSGGPASRAADEIEQAHAARSDMDDSKGSPTDDTAPLPPDSAAQDEVFRVHDAVGGRDSTVAEDVDAPIDTSRDPEHKSEQQEPPLDLGDAASDLDEQDQLSAFDGARADEFTDGGYEPAPVDQDDVEAAAEGEPADMENDTSTSDVGNLRQSVDRSTEAPGGAQEKGAETTNNASGRPPTDTSGTDTATREEIESEAEGDAFVQGDEAVTAPGQSPPEAFGDPSTGTTEPSRSATGNDVDEAPDALGTTLDHSDESFETFDPDAANLSAQDEMSMSDLEAGGQPGSASGENSARMTSFDTGAAAEAGFDQPSVGDESVDTPDQPYADIADEPTETASEDTELDDFSGSDYPSDRRIDPLAGDDRFDAIEPDIGQETSSAGDLDTPPPGEDLLINEEPPAAAADPGFGKAGAIDQDVVSADDDSIGDAPGTIEMATGEADDAAFTLEDAPGADDDASNIETPEEVENATSPLNDDDSTAPHELMDDGGAGTASVQDDDLPAGCVRGNGTTNTPEGYPVKGNANSKIYHLPNFPSYAGTKAEFCFATEQHAIDAGYRAPGRRNRGRKNR